MSRGHTSRLFIYGTVALAALVAIGLVFFVEPPDRTEQTPVPTLTPTPTPTPPPTKDCPDAYKRTLTKHSDLMTDDARNYRVRLWEPGLTLMQALCIDLLGKTADEATLFRENDEEVAAAKALGRELAQDPILRDDLVRAALRWYRSFTDYRRQAKLGRESRDAEMQLVDSYRAHGETRDALMFVIEGERYPLLELGHAIDQTYRGSWSAVIEIPSGAGEIIVCSELDRRRIVYHAPHRAAVQLAGDDDPYADAVYCKPGIF